MTALENQLAAQPAFAKIIVNPKPYLKLDFSASNPALNGRDLSDTSLFSKFVFEELLSGNEYNGIGGYLEKRVIYRHRTHFGNADAGRDIHLGTDIWVAAGEPVFAPIEGKVHSFAFNNNPGDYGPTIILEHKIAGFTFFTLYGHLSLSSLTGLEEGKMILPGSQIGSVGPFPENGDWPPHLHFQIISDMQHLKGDFPGVCSEADKEKFALRCPNANLILRIEENS